MKRSRDLDLETRLLIRTVASRLRMLRKDKGVTQQEVIKQLGSRSQGYISELENGTINMTLGTLVRFATALGYRTEVTFVPKPETE